MAKIERVRARELLDSRGNPTVEVELLCSGSAWGRAIVPSGASTGRHEAVELRDGDPSRFSGKGVLKAVANVQDRIAPLIVGRDAEDQSGIDRALIDLDGTSNKSSLGANSLLGTSLAVAHAAAAARRVPLFQYLAELWHNVQLQQPQAIQQSVDRKVDTQSNYLLPLPMVNMISGGLHAGGNLAFQDFLIMPVGATTYSEALHWIVNTYHRLGGVLRKHGYESVLLGDEGGYGPRLESNRQALDLVLEAIQAAGLQPGSQVGIALDVASSHFYHQGRYRLVESNRQIGTAEELVELLADWVDSYPILSIEDGCAEDDWDGWKLLSDRLRSRVQLVGDDLFVTHPGRLARGVDSGVGNAVLIKLNQIGTLSETFQVLALARAAGYGTVISARSGETEDTTMAHLAVAVGAGQIKIGSVARGERLVKYNELLRIEDVLGRRARFATGEHSRLSGCGAEKTA